MGEVKRLKLTPTKTVLFKETSQEKVSIDVKIFDQARKMKAEELTKKREEAERKARRGEIDPTHEFTFHLIGQVETGYFGLILCSLLL